MFFRVLWTEYLKLKRTLAVWMVLVSPLVLLLLQFTVSYKERACVFARGQRCVGAAWKSGRC